MRLAHILLLIPFAISTGCCMNYGSCGASMGCCGPCGRGVPAEPGGCDDGCSSCSTPCCGPLIGGKLPHMMAARAKSHLTCGSGCGEVVWNEWMADPPDCCDPCNSCGQWVGNRAGPRRPLFGLLRCMIGKRYCDACNNAGCDGGCADDCCEDCGGDFASDDLSGVETMVGDANWNPQRTRGCRSCGS